MMYTYTHLCRLSSVLAPLKPGPQRLQEWGQRFSLGSWSLQHQVHQSHNPMAVAFSAGRAPWIFSDANCWWKFSLEMLTL